MLLCLFFFPVSDNILFGGPLLNINAVISLLCFSPISYKVTGFNLFVLIA